MNALVPVRPQLNSQELAHHVLKLNEQFACAMVQGRRAEARRIHRQLQELGK